MKVLALDISTKTGWAFFENTQLVNFGTIFLDEKVGNFGEYPFNYVKYTRFIAIKIKNLIEEIKPTTIVIEETNRGKQRFTQKMLEWIHLSVLQELIDSGIIVRYVSSSAWRKVVGMNLTSQDKKNNKLVNEAKRKGKSKKSLGLKGKITKKHLAIRLVDQLFQLNLKMKSNDAADAILLGLAYLKGAEISQGK